uniref:Di19 zinc-binding domain-containing protein n=1 Tax=Oncorhynchus tshawytscha TaxID=74940 RepID=A0A8C8J2H6_ONCTS
YFRHTSCCKSCLSHLLIGFTHQYSKPFHFSCPFCGARNLDQQKLAQHCMENHRNDPNKVVCPVCSAMPGGTPFSYVTFVMRIRVGIWALSEINHSLYYYSDISHS